MTDNTDAMVHAQHPRIVVGPVNRTILESGALSRAGATEFFALLHDDPFWSRTLVGAVLDDQGIEWLASRSVSLSVSSESSLENVLRLWRRMPIFSVDLEIHSGVTLAALRELRKVKCPVRLLGFDFDQTYHTSYSEIVADWVGAGGISEVVYSLCTEMAADPIDWLTGPREWEDALTIEDVRREIALAQVPVLVSVRSSIRRALAFQEQQLPRAAGLFFGLEREPDRGGRFPARVSWEELIADQNRDVGVPPGD